jgi:CBS domain-containing protein
MPMQLSQPVTDIMTTEPTVVKDTQPIKEAAELLRQRRFAGVPVVSGERKLVGVLSYKDVLDAIGETTKGATLAGDPVHGFYVEGEVLIIDGAMSPIDHLTGVVSDHMSKDVITVSIDDTVLDAVKLFAKKNIHRVPVVDGNGDLVGVVTTSDIVRFVAETAE